MPRGRFQLKFYSAAFLLTGLVFAGFIWHVTHSYLAILIMLPVLFCAWRVVLKTNEELTKEADERQQKEAQLRESRERFELVARATNDAVWDWDLVTNKVWWNTGVQILFGYSPEQVGTDVSWRHEHLHPEDRQRVITGIQAVIHRGDKFWSDEYRYLRADGSYAYVLDRGYVMPDELGRPVRMIGAMLDITERKRVEEALLRNAFYDPLTGLSNRALFMDRLGRCIERAKRRRDYLFAVLSLDLDRFKIINESLGHAVGDQLLAAIARRLEGSLRPSDTFAHLSGDEFAILLEDVTDVSDATRVADRIQKELTLPFNLNGQEIFTAVSIGIALSLTGYEKPADLLRDAELAMYRAKTHGKGHYEMFDEEMHARAIGFLRLEADLRRAVERWEFIVYYQPIVSLKTNCIVAAEALLRWNHPQRNLVLPADFIPIAEETGLIVPIGEWVLRTVCEQNKRWRQAGHHSLNVTVNLSARQFEQKNLHYLIAKILQETGLDPHALALELTESIVMENVEENVTTLRALKELGVQLSLDDFGTGYSSLIYLRRFPFDTLKIDRSFVRNITINAEDATIASAVIALAHSLRLNVIAEGVETEEQLAFLRSQNCDEAQGFLFSPPVPVTQFSQMIQGVKPCRT